jgi:hypothetical protein
LLLDALTDDPTQAGWLDGFHFDILALKTLAAAIRLLRRPRRQAPRGDLLRPHSHTLEVNVRIEGKLPQAQLDLAIHNDAAGIAVAKIIDERWLVLRGNRIALSQIPMRAKGWSLLR